MDQDKSKVKETFSIPKKMQIQGKRLHSFSKNAANNEPVAIFFRKQLKVSQANPKHPARLRHCQSHGLWGLGPTLKVAQKLQI